MRGKHPLFSRISGEELFENAPPRKFKGDRDIATAVFITLAILMAFLFAIVTWVDRAYPHRRNYGQSSGPPSAPSSW